MGKITKIVRALRLAERRVCMRVIDSVFGRLQKTYPRGREDSRVWYRETMFSQVVSYDFL